MDAVWEFLKQLPWEKAIVAIALTAICLIVIKIILSLFDKLTNKSKMDEMVKKILRIFIKAVLLFISVTIVLGSLGISVTSLVSAVERAKLIENSSKNIYELETKKLNLLYI